MFAPQRYELPLEQRTGHLVSPLGRASCKALLFICRGPLRVFDYGATAEKALRRKVRFV